MWLPGTPRLLTAMILTIAITSCGSDDASTVDPSPTSVPPTTETSTTPPTPPTTTAISTTTTDTSTTTTATTTTTTTATVTTTTVLPQLDEPLTVVFIGDSTGRVVAEGLAEVAAAEGSIELTIATRNGCGLMTTGDLMNPMSQQWEPVPDVCVEQVEQVIAAVVAEQQPDVVLAMVSSWDVSERRWSDGVESAPVDPLHQERLGADYARMADRVLDAGASEVIWLLQPTPNGFWQNAGVGQDDDRWQQASRDVVQALAADDPRAGVLDLVGWMADNGLLDDVPTRPDGIHFSPEAAREVGAWIRSELLIRSIAG